MEPPGRLEAAGRVTVKPKHTERYWKIIPETANEKVVACASQSRSLLADCLQFQSFQCCRHFRQIEAYGPVPEADYGDFSLSHEFVHHSRGGKIERGSKLFLGYQMQVHHGRKK